MPLFGMGQDNPAQDQGQAQPQVYPGQTKTPSTIIAKGVRLEGDFKSHGDVQIEGEVFGTVQTDNLLTIGKDSLVKATITAAEAVIAGRVEGNITVLKRLECKNTAQIKGDIKCEIIAIEAGAAIKGNMDCGTAKFGTEQDKHEGVAKAT